MIRSSEFWGGLFWLAIGAFVLWSGRNLGIGVVNDPGAGFAFFWVGVLLMAFSAMIILASFKSPGAALADLWRDTRWGKVLLVIALLVSFGFLFETVGFVALSIILLLILMLVVDRVNPLVAVPVAVFVPLGVFFVVTKWLKIQMPTGILAPWLG